MTTAIMKYEALSEILLPLANAFETGNEHGLRLDPSSREEGPLKECLSELIAEGWLARCLSLNHYALTMEGYRHFEPRLRALRDLQTV